MREKREGRAPSSSDLACGCGMRLEFSECSGTPCQKSGSSKRRKRVYSKRLSTVNMAAAGKTVFVCHRAMISYENM